MTADVLPTEVLANVLDTVPTCACADGGRPGQPSPCDPKGIGRYCPSSICWCGSCPWWKPAPKPNYAAAIAGADNSREWR